MRRIKTRFAENIEKFKLHFQRAVARHKIKTQYCKDIITLFVILFLHIYLVEYSIF